MDPWTPDDAGYVIRYGFNVATTMMLGVCAGVVIILLFGQFDPVFREKALEGSVSLVLLSAVTAAAAGARLRHLSLTAWRTVVVRVDREGITLEALRFERRRRAHFGWDDVAEVVLFARYGSIGRTRRGHAFGLHLQPDARGVVRFSRRGPTDRYRAWYSYIGVRLRPDTRVTATTLDPDGVRKLMKQVTNVPTKVLARSRPFHTRRLDERGLCEAVARYAPHVRVVQLDKTGRLRRVGTA